MTKLRVKVDVDPETDRFAVWKDGMGWVECDLGPLLNIAELLDASIALCDVVGHIGYDVQLQAVERLRHAMEPYLPSADDVRGILR